LKKSPDSFLKLFTVILILLISTFHLSAGELNEVENSPGFWLNLGLGKSHFGPTLNTSMSYGFNKNLLILRYLSADEFRFNVEGHYDEPALRVREIGLLYGKYILEKGVRLSLSAGVSYVHGVDRGNHLQFKEYERVNISAFGIPAELNVQAEISRYFGFGFTAFGNFNNQKSFYGGSIKLIFGKLGRN